jgi:hypothetical protein
MLINYMKLVVQWSDAISVGSPEIEKSLLEL